MREWVRSGDSIASYHCLISYKLLHTAVGVPGPVTRQLLGRYSYVSLGMKREPVHTAIGSEMTFDRDDSAAEPDLSTREGIRTDD